MTDFQNEVALATGAFALFRGEGIPATQDAAAKRSMTAYKRWFEKHREWFSDKLDFDGIGYVLRMLSIYGHPERVRQLFRADESLLKNFEAKAIENWYTKYTMFDPAMGMYDPDEALNYFRQRMLKRLNVVVIHLEEQVIRKRK